LNRTDARGFALGGSFALNKRLASAHSAAKTIAPHSQENYLMREMGFRVARKHAAKLRRLALLLGAAVPLALTVLLFALYG
jgi:hypothetical protein